MYVDPKRPHLGGYHRGGDPLSWYPEMWEWLVESENIKSVLDVGCGEGHALHFFEERGCRVAGYDGIAQDHARIYLHDYTQGPADEWASGRNDFDLVWCCEFVEHIEERYLPNVLPTFCCAPLVLMTHALPGQGGHHHVNCRIDEYWLGVMAAIGYAHDRVLTMRTRELAGGGYYEWSGLAFRRV